MAAPPTNTAKWQRYFFFYGTICLVIASLYFGRVFILPLVLATLLAFILNPLVTLLQKRGVHRFVSVLLVVGFATLVAAGIIGTVLYQAKELATELPKYKDNIITKIESFQKASEGMWVENIAAMFTDFSKAWKGKEKKETERPVRVQIENSNVPLVTAILQHAAEFLVNAGLVLLLVFFMLLSREDLRNRVIGVCGPCHLTATTRALDEASQRVSRFLGMQLLVNASYGVALGVGLFIMGVPFALVWGVLAALLRYIPYLGPWLAALFPLTITFASMEGWAPVLGVLGFILVLELISNNLMEPWLYGRSVGISEIAVLVSVAFWAWLWGPLGLILATPITACLVVFGRYVTGLSLLPHFLGNEPVLATEVSFYQRLLARDVDEASDLVETRLEEHRPETVYDEFFLPALLQMRHYQHLGELNREDRKFILSGIRQIVDEVVEPAMDDVHEKNRQNAAAGSAAQRVRTLGLAWDPVGETGLYLLKSMTDLTRTEWRIFPIQAGWEEAVDQIRREKPNILILGSLQTRRWGRIRSFCRRIKNHFPDLVVLVQTWGQEDAAVLGSQLKESGAAEVATGFVEGWEQYRRHVEAAAKSATEKPDRVNGAKRASARRRG